LCSKAKHLGLGLGIEFLKHIERTKIIVHIVDMANIEGRNPVEDYKKINNELESYDLKLMGKVQIVVANKMDMPEAKENLEKFIKETKVDVIPISALTSENLDKLIYKIADVLDTIKSEEKIDVIKQVVEYTVKEKQEPFTLVLQDDGVYNVVGPMIEKLMQKTDFNNDPSIRRFAKQLKDLGVDDALREKGVKDGDTVRILDYEFEFYD